jgi:hypothetical protein
VGSQNSTLDLEQADQFRLTAVQGSERLVAQAQLQKDMTVSPKMTKAALHLFAAIERVSACRKSRR